MTDIAFGTNLAAERVGISKRHRTLSHCNVFTKLKALLHKPAAYNF